MHRFAAAAAAAAASGTSRSKHPPHGSMYSPYEQTAGAEGEPGAAGENPLSSDRQLRSGPRPRHGDPGTDGQGAEQADECPGTDLLWKKRKDEAGKLCTQRASQTWWSDQLSRRSSYGYDYDHGAGAGAVPSGSTRADPNISTTCHQPSLLRRGELHTAAASLHSRISDIAAAAHIQAADRVHTQQLTGASRGVVCRLRLDLEPCAARGSQSRQISDPAGAQAAAAEDSSPASEGRRSCGPARNSLWFRAFAGVGGAPAFRILWGHP